MAALLAKRRVERMRAKLRRPPPPHKLFRAASMPSVLELSDRAGAVTPIWSTTRTRSQTTPASQRINDGEGETASSPSSLPSAAPDANIRAKLEAIEQYAPPYRVIATSIASDSAPIWAPIEEEARKARKQVEEEGALSPPFNRRRTPTTIVGAAAVVPASMEERKTKTAAAPSSAEAEENSGHRKVAPPPEFLDAGGFGSGSAESTSAPTPPPPPAPLLATTVGGEKPLSARGLISSASAAHYQNAAPLTPDESTSGYAPRVEPPSILLKLLTKADEGLGQVLEHFKRGTPIEAVAIDVLETAVRRSHQIRALPPEKVIGLENARRLHQWIDTSGALDMLKERFAKMADNYRLPPLPPPPAFS